MLLLTFGTRGLVRGIQTMTMDHSFKAMSVPRIEVTTAGPGITAEKETTAVISLHASGLVQGTCSGHWEVSFVGPWAP